MRGPGAIVQAVRGQRGRRPDMSSPDNQHRTGADSGLSYVPPAWLILIMGRSLYGLSSFWTVFSLQDLPPGAAFLIYGGVIAGVVTVLWGLYLLGLAIGRSARFPRQFTIWQAAFILWLLVRQAYIARVQLSAAGFYKTPKIHWDRSKGRGHAFYYYAYGAACSEVSVDTLTGEYVVERTDILHDAGRSLNPAIDLGQVEGGFIQGMGWLTTEELWWDGKGRLRTHAPSTYKIPLASDRPKIFNVALTDWSEAYEPTVHRSKAVGEPPLPLGLSVLHALADAVASVAGHKVCPRLDAPATPERVLMAVERMKKVAAK